MANPQEPLPIGDVQEPRSTKGENQGQVPRRPRGRVAGNAVPPERRADPGGNLEFRVARLEFAEGAMVRLRVPVQAEEADPGRRILTDVDILAIDVDQRLRLSRSSLECKSGKGESGEPDRLLWLAGFRQLLRLD